MKIELKPEFHFYEGPKFLERTAGSYKPWLEYELKEVTPGIASRSIGFLNGAVVQRLIDYKRDILNRRLPSPKGVVSIGTMINWVESQF